MMVALMASQGKAGCCCGSGPASPCSIGCSPTTGSPVIFSFTNTRYPTECVPVSVPYQSGLFWETGICAGPSCSAEFGLYYEYALGCTGGSGGMTVTFYFASGAM